MKKNYYNTQNIYLLFKKYLVFFIIFLITLSLRLIGIQEKHHMFIDCPFSVMMSTPTNLSPDGKIFKTQWNEYSLTSGKEYSLKQFKKSLFENRANIKSIYNDLKTLRKNNIDKPHTNLYYSFLRIWNIGFDGINVQHVIKRDCVLNLVFFTFSFFFLYKLLSLIKNEKKFISIGLFFGFLSTGSISNSFLIREYAMQEMFLTIFMYIFVYIYKSIILEKQYDIINFKNICIYSFITSLYMLSGYFSTFLILPSFCVLFFSLVFQKKYNLLPKIILIPTISTLFLLILYPPYFLNLFSNDYYNNSKSLLLLNILNLKNPVLIKYLFNFIFYNIFFLLIIKGISLKCTNITDNSSITKKEYFLFIIILIPATFYLYMVSMHPLASYWFPVFSRFLFPIFPVFSIIFIPIMYNFKNYILLFCMFLYFTSAFLPLKGYQMNYTGSILFKNRFEHLDLQKNDLFIHENIKKYKIVIYKPSWAYINNIIYLPDNSIIKFENKIINNYNPYDEFFFITKDKEVLKKLKKEKVCSPPFCQSAEYICLIKNL